MNCEREPILVILLISKIGSRLPSYHVTNAFVFLTHAVLEIYKCSYDNNSAAYCFDSRCIATTSAAAAAATTTTTATTNTKTYLRAITTVNKKPSCC